MLQKDLDRFLKKIIKNAAGCWLWTAYTSDGYGIFSIKSHPKKAHRVSYEHFVGPIPAGLGLDHLCRTRNCVNPEHLEPVSWKENMQRSPIHISVTQANRTHCKRGHEFTEENTYRYKQWRRCRKCSYLRNKNY